MKRMWVNLSGVTVNVCVLILIFISLVTAASFPRQRRQSFFQCSGWGAGCTNSAYPTAKTSYNKQKGETASGRSRGHPSTYLFTSGSSWSAIGKRYRPVPRFRRVLSPIMFSSNAYERLLRNLLDIERLKTVRD